jgi:hypothetical protein
VGIMEGKKKKREPGEYSFPKGSPYKNVYFPERNYFLNVVVDIVPEVFEDILDCVVPELNKIYEKQKGAGEFKPINWSAVKEEFFIDLKEAIINLKKKYNLIEADNCKDDWISILILEEANKLLTTGKYKGENDGRKLISKEVEYIPFEIDTSFEDLASYFFQKNKEELSINLEEESLFWNPIFKSKEAKKTEIMEKIDKKMDLICDYMEKNNFEKIEPRKDMYERLVLFQVKKMTYSNVAENFDSDGEKFMSSDSIQKAVKRLSERIGLKRRTQI